MRSFSDLLAEWQGVIRLKPGRPVVTYKTGAELMEIFGEIPAARTFGNLMLTTQKVDDLRDLYKVSIRPAT